MSQLSLLFCCLSLFSLQVLGFAPSPQNLTNSLHIAVNAAIGETSYVLKQIKLQQSKSGSVRERAALSDCLEFYELTITHLNKTLEPNLDTTASDVQIWLSAALTNLENCKTSIAEQNITHPVFLDSNIATKMINNSLAINDEIMKGTSENLHRWLPDGEFINLSKLGSLTTIVVAQDGSGKYRTIKKALDASRNVMRGVMIRIKQGTYSEYLEIGRDMKNIILVGDGIGKTIITGDRSAKSGFSTRDSATMKVMGDGFVARDITFRNTAGVNAGQAVALMSISDRSAYYRCAFEGYQDTLWAASHRQLYEQCEIYGTIDFIFGDAAVVIQNSFIYARVPQRGQDVVITAQGRNAPNEPTGISIVNCRVQPDPSQKQGLRGVRVFLGRPWKSYARTVYMKSYLDGMVDPAGWREWSSPGESRTATVYYAEFGNYGPGSSTRRRVKWKGVKVIKREADEFNVANFIASLKWLPQTCVPFSTRI